MTKKVECKDGVLPPPPPDLQTNFHQLNPIGPRYQWEGNGGYCGEVSFISAGLYYGQYLSQYDVRAMAWACQDIAARNQTKNTQSAQLLLGVNDATVAQMLKLGAEVFDVQDSETFLQWVKKNVVSGYPVIVGVFYNEFLLSGGEITNPNYGDTEYDHIVPVMEWGSSRPLDQEDISGDVILLSDNGLYGTDTSPVPDNTVVYYYDYAIPYFLATRQQANTQTDNNRVYSLLTLPQTNEGNKQNYAIAIKGVLDESRETLPVTLTTSINYECPAIVDGSDIRPASQQVTLTITVSGLTPGQTYYLYYYDNEINVPVRNFNAQSGDPWQEIDATADTWTGSMTIQSNEKAFFRAVNKNAG